MATAICALMTQGCKKKNGIDNNNVISTPYGLYYADNVGAMFNTNDGLLFRTVFNPDGYVQRSIVTSGLNVLFIKNNLHLSIDNGNNFNINNYGVNPAATHRSMILDVPSHDRLYLCSTNSSYGISYSEDHGVSWQNDTLVDKNVIKTGFFPTSLTQLKSGDLFAYSNGNQKLYKRTAKNARWIEITPGGLPATATYFLSHLNDALIASDVAGGGVYFSVDRGVSWNPYSGIGGVAIHDTYAPFDQNLLVGTSKGIFRYVSGSFGPSNNGLAAETIVYSIIGKTDTYKNGAIKNYIYIGTNTGLYRSEDGGQNWVYMDDPYHSTATRHDIRLVY